MQRLRQPDPTPSSGVGSEVLVAIEACLDLLDAAQNRGVKVLRLEGFFIDDEVVYPGPRIGSPTSCPTPSPRRIFVPGSCWPDGGRRHPTSADQMRSDASGSYMLAVVLDDSRRLPSLWGRRVPSCFVPSRIGIARSTISPFEYGFACGSSGSASAADASSRRTRLRAATQRPTSTVGTALPGWSTLRSGTRPRTGASKTDTWAVGPRRGPPVAFQAPARVKVLVLFGPPVHAIAIRKDASGAGGLTSSGSPRRCSQAPTASRDTPCRAVRDGASAPDAASGEYGQVPDGQQAFG